MTALTTTLYVFVCAGIAWGCFCRAVKLDRSAWRPIRAAVFSLACASLYAIYAAVFTVYVPDLPDLVMPAAMLLMLGASSKRWWFGMPDEYRSDFTPFEATDAEDRTIP